MKKILFILTTIFCFSIISCQNEEAETPEFSGEKMLVNIVVDSAENTKSAISIAENGIADVTLFFFVDGVLSESIYTVPDGSGNLTIESTKGYDPSASVDVYGLVNFGDKRSIISEGDPVADLLNYSYSISSVTTVNSTGFPMAGSELSAPVGTAFTLTVHRLMAKYGFRINTSGLKYGSFTVTGLSLKNSAKTVTPFKEGSKATSTSQVMSGDYATSSNITSLRNGTGVYFYTLENMQGTLLSGNTDPWKKIPSNISKSDLCTYIEVVGTYNDNSGGLTATHTYRMYLGQDNVTNFDVIRNTKYEYTLTLADDGFLKATWKAERDITSDTRSMAFGKSTYEVEYDADCPVTLSCSPGNIDCKYTLSSNLVSAGVTFDSNYMVLRQTQELDADVTGTLTATSWDGEKTATCTVVAKEYVPGDIIIIIKPTDDTINMTEPEAQSASAILALVNPEDHSEVYEYYETATDWTVASSKSTIAEAELDGYVTKANQWQNIAFTGQNEGSTVVTVTCKYEDVTYSNTITMNVNEDRVITLAGLPSAIYKEMPYPCAVATNYKGQVNLTTSNSNLSFYENQECTTKLTSIENDSAVDNQRQVFVRYDGSSNTTVSAYARTTNDAVESFSSTNAYGEAGNLSFTHQGVINGGGAYSMEPDCFERIGLQYITPDGLVWDVTEIANWNSSNTAYATIDKGILYTYNNLTNGNPIDIEAEFCGQTASFVFFVEYKTYYIYPTSLSLKRGETTKLSFSFYNSVLGEDVSDDSRTGFMSSNTSVATVDQNGNVTAISSGSATISAWNESMSFYDTRECVITVTDEVVQDSQKLYITGDSVMGFGEEQQLKAIFVETSSGVPVITDVTNSATWSYNLSSDYNDRTGCLDVTSNGYVTAIGVGKDYVSVTYNGLNATFTLHVEDHSEDASNPGYYYTGYEFEVVSEYEQGEYDVKTLGRMKMYLENKLGSTKTLYTNNYYLSIGNEIRLGPQTIKYLKYDEYTSSPLIIRTYGSCPGNYNFSNMVGGDFSFN